MQKTQFKGVLILLLTALIWGTSFAAQSIGMENVQAFTFNGIRTLLGASILLPVLLVKYAVGVKSGKECKKFFDKTTLIHGSIVGVALFVAGNFQQFAFNYTTSGKIAFITAFYMFFVPIIGIFLRKKTPVVTWFCVAAGCVGLYLLCIGDAGISDINRGDFLAFICSIFFAVHIIAIDKFGVGIDPIKLSFVQFTVAGTLAIICMFIFEQPNPANIRTSMLPLMYSGFLSCGVAYTLQIIGQKYTAPTVASLLMCMESVFGVITGAVVLHERFTVRELAGCIIMFAAIVVSQLAEAKKPSEIKS